MQSIITQWQSLLQEIAEAKNGFEKTSHKFMDSVIKQQINTVYNTVNETSGFSQNLYHTDLPKPGGYTGYTKPRCLCTCTFSASLTICHWLFLETAWQFLLLSAELQGQVLHVSNEWSRVLCILLLGSFISSGSPSLKVEDTSGKASQSNQPLSLQQRY